MLRRDAVLAVEAEARAAGVAARPDRHPRLRSRVPKRSASALACVAQRHQGGEPASRCRCRQRLRRACSCTGASQAAGSAASGSCGTKRPVAEGPQQVVEAASAASSSSHTSTRSPSRKACSISAQTGFRRARAGAFGQHVEVDFAPCACCGSGRAGAGAADQEIRQQRHRPAGAAFLCAGKPGRAGDVQVRPVQALGELAEEGAGRDGAAIAAADIGQVREIARSCSA